MKFKLKDPGSAITHGIALLLAAVGAVPLIIKAARSYDVLHIVALSIFILTMVLLYAASTIYHSVDSTEKVNRRLRKMDHMMIFVMIAGSYTPVCLIVLHNRIGYILCALVWSIAVLGIILKGCPISASSSGSRSNGFLILRLYFCDTSSLATSKRTAGILDTSGISSFKICTSFAYSVFRRFMAYWRNPVSIAIISSKLSIYPISKSRLVYSFK